MVDSRERGEWYLLDAFDLKVIRHGDVSWTGVSARKQMSETERKLLLPAVRGLLQSDSGADKYATEAVDRHGTWRIEVRVLRAPLSKACVALLAICCLRDQQAPNPPLVGAWEWEISGDGSVTRTYWSSELYALYECEPEKVNEVTGPGGVGLWFAETIDPRDRQNMKLSIHRGIREAEPTLQTLSYRIRPHIKAGNERSKSLRLAGRASRDPETGTTWLRGVSYESEGPFLEKLSWTGPVPAEELSLLYLELLPECALATMSLDDWNLFDVSPGWERSGLSIGVDGNLRPLIHPADQPLAAQFLESVVDRKGVQVLNRPIQILMKDGSWQPCSISAGGITLAGGYGSYVGLRISPRPSQESWTASNSAKRSPVG